MRVICGAASKSLCSMTFHQIFLLTHDGQLQPHLLVIQRLFKNITLIVFVRLNSFRVVSLLSNLSECLHTLDEVNKVVVKFEKMFCELSLTLGRLQSLRNISQKCHQITYFVTQCHDRGWMGSEKAKICGRI